MVLEDVRLARRKPQVNMACSLNGSDQTFPVLEISAKGFSFLCRKGESPYQNWETAEKIVVRNAEGVEVIAGEGTIVHVTEFDFLHTQVGVYFTRKIMDRTAPGTIRVPRHYPKVRLTAKMKPDGSENGHYFSGVVQDFTATTARIAFSEGAAPDVQVGDVLNVTLSAGDTLLPESQAHVVRQRGDGSEIVVQYADQPLDVSRIETISNVVQNRQVILSALAPLQEYRGLSSEYKALVGEWRTYLARLQQALEREEAKGLYPLEPEKEMFLEGIEDEILPVLEGYILRLNSIADTLGREESIAYKRYFRENLNAFFRQSPYAASVIDKEKGYAGDYETIKYFFQNPYSGDTLFGKLMNRFQVGLDAVSAHQERIQFLFNLLCSLYDQDEGEDFSFLSLGSGPAEEVHRFVSRNSFDRPVRATLVDMDAFALADFSERLQYLPHDNFELELVNGNLLQILRRRETDPVKRQFPFVYCAGLFDYFKDNLCRKVIKYIIAHTRPGGVAVITNVHKRNRTRHFMDYCGGWQIIHRDEEEVRSLVPPDYETELYYDRNRANIFLRIVVPDGAS